jgi:hypothetical protein
MENPIALEKHNIIPKLGSFILRDESCTIGVGKVIKYKPVKDSEILAQPLVSSNDKNEESKVDLPGA